MDNTSNPTSDLDDTEDIRWETLFHVYVILGSFRTKGKRTCFRKSVLRNANSEILSLKLYQIRFETLSSVSRAIFVWLFAESLFHLTNFAKACWETGFSEIDATYRTHQQSVYEYPVPTRVESIR